MFLFLMTETVLAARAKVFLYIFFTKCNWAMSTREEIGEEISLVNEEDRNDDNGIHSR